MRIAKQEGDDAVALVGVPRGLGTGNQPIAKPIPVAQNDLRGRPNGDAVPLVGNFIVDDGGPGLIARSPDKLHPKLTAVPRHQVAVAPAVPTGSFVRSVRGSIQGIAHVRRTMANVWI